MAKKPHHPLMNHLLTMAYNHLLTTATTNQRLVSRQKLENKRDEEEKFQERLKRKATLVTAGLQRESDGGLLEDTHR